MNLNQNHTQSGPHRRRRHEVGQLDDEQRDRIRRGRHAVAIVIMTLGVFFGCIAVGIFVGWAWAFAVAALSLIMTAANMFSEDES